MPGNIFGYNGDNFDQPLPDQQTLLVASGINGIQEINHLTEGNSFVSARYEAKSIATCSSKISNDQINSSCCEEKMKKKCCLVLPGWLSLFQLKKKTLTQIFHKHVFHLLQSSNHNKMFKDVDVYLIYRNAAKIKNLIVVICKV